MPDCSTATPAVRPTRCGSASRAPGGGQLCIELAELLAQRRLHVLSHQHRGEQSVAGGGGRMEFFLTRAPSRVSALSFNEGWKKLRYSREGHAL